MKIADHYDTLTHDPNNAGVSESYRALKNEIRAQWDFARAHGMTFEPTETDPYPDSKSMIMDVTKNNHLRIYTGGQLPDNHPLGDIGQNGSLYNIMFRGVHDLFGHAAHNNSFGATGEYRAFLAHSQMFSNRALGALATETIAQTSWFFFGKHLRVNGRVPKKGEEGYTEPRNRPYAPQKANIFNRYYT
jgi:hypothetical protein